LPAEAPATTRTLYVYGITWASSARALRGAGLADADVEAVVFDDLAALTSRLPSAQVQARRRELLRHSEVLGAAFAEDVVLPLTFGIVFEDEQQVVRDLLEPRHDELRDLLRKFAGRAELRVTAMYVEDAVLADIVAGDPQITRLREATRTQPDVQSHPLRVALGERVASRLSARAAREANALLAKLTPLALDHDVSEPMLELEVLRASFLVERSRIATFDRAMDDLARRHAGLITFKYVGPLPPHSFVSLEDR
jgi:Gas vesicle synthesis protein GvpL/GvpF